MRRNLCEQVIPKPHGDGITHTEFKSLFFCIYLGYRSVFVGIFSWLVRITCSYFICKNISIPLLDHTKAFGAILTSCKGSVSYRYVCILSSQVVSLPFQSVIHMEVANFCAAMDTLIDQDGGCKLLCSNGHLDRSRWYVCGITLMV